MDENNTSMNVYWKFWYQNNYNDNYSSGRDLFINIETNVVNYDVVLRYFLPINVLQTVKIASHKRKS